MSKVIKFNDQAITPCPLTMSLSATSTCFLNTSRDGVSTTSLFQCLTTLLEKKCFLTSNLNPS